MKCCLVCFALFKLIEPRIYIDQSHIQINIPFSIKIFRKHIYKTITKKKFIQQTKSYFYNTYYTFNNFNCKFFYYLVHAKKCNFNVKKNQNINRRIIAINIH